MKFCTEADNNILSLIKKGYEADPFELYYARGHIKKELYQFGSLSNFYETQSAHLGVTDGSYYADLLNFIDKLAPGTIPELIDLDESDESWHEEKVQEIEQQESLTFGAIGNLMIALKRGTYKKIKTRNKLIACLEKRNEEDLSARDKEVNRLLVIYFSLENLIEKGAKVEQGDIDTLSDKLKISNIQWNLLPATEHRGLREAVSELNEKVRKYAWSMQQLDTDPLLQLTNDLK